MPTYQHSPTLQNPMCVRPYRSEKSGLSEVRILFPPWVRIIICFDTHKIDKQIVGKMYTGKCEKEKQDCSREELSVYVEWEGEHLHVVK